ncbi:hypothetical protein CEUSTIGMA_g4585.t1 [Chlamydomonas eustigma]|uniref:Uncharacterized protein n=1 Tax=Chlamydomonas eustigma TaxID=1157962 RepID=A0A250X2H1_9CHLO|nr:hypothetical protein CEUSTIGMA_g4585.t1 [Chlamydomonas eustigma]|eukprot:GAX77139.1 hypothetical protein CEUSTIGMA_g4585.t1 [Chlamydomonas eustigma]
MFKTSLVALFAIFLGSLMQCDARGRRSTHSLHEGSFAERLNGLRRAGGEESEQTRKLIESLDTADDMELTELRINHRNLNQGSAPAYGAYPASSPTMLVPSPVPSPTMVVVPSPVPSPMMVVPSPVPSSPTMVVVPSPVPSPMMVVPSPVPSPIATAQDSSATPSPTDTTSGSTVQLSFTVSLQGADLSGIQSSMSSFETNFINAIAAILGVASSQISILSLTPGSVMVTFAVNTASDSAASVTSALTGGSTATIPLVVALSSFGVSSASVSTSVAPTSSPVTAAPSPSTSSPSPVTATPSPVTAAPSPSTSSPSTSSPSTSSPSTSSPSPSASSPSPSASSPSPVTATPSPVTAAPSPSASSPSTTTAASPTPTATSSPTSSPIPLPSPVFYPNPTSGATTLSATLSLMSLAAAAAFLCSGFLL